MPSAPSAGSGSLRILRLVLSGRLASPRCSDNKGAPTHDLPSLRRGRAYEQKPVFASPVTILCKLKPRSLQKETAFLQGTFATRVRSVRTFGRSSTRPATTIISIESPRSDLSLARGEVLRRRALWSGHAALRHSTGPGRRTSSSSSAPAWRGDGRDEDRRSQDHQRPSLAAGEIQEGSAAGAIKNPLPQSASST